MKRTLPVIFTGVFIALAVLAMQSDLFAQAQPVKPGEDPYWKLNQFRHGPNYFKKTNLVETTPLVEGEWDFQHYQ